MGQGQEIVARKILQSAVSDGSWVLLQNAHLGLPFVLEVHLHLVCTMLQEML